MTLSLLTTATYEKTSFGPFTRYLQKLPQVEAILKHSRYYQTYKFPSIEDLVNGIPVYHPNGRYTVHPPAVTKHPHALGESVRGAMEQRKARRCLQRSLNAKVTHDLETVVRDAVEDALQRAGEGKVQGVRRVLHTIACCYGDTVLNSDLRQWRVTPSVIFQEGLGLAEYAVLCLSTAQKVEWFVEGILFCLMFCVVIYWMIWIDLYDGIANNYAFHYSLRVGRA